MPCFAELGGYDELGFKADERRGIPVYQDMERIGWGLSLTRGKTQTDHEQ